MRAIVILLLLVLMAVPLSESLQWGKNEFSSLRPPGDYVRKPPGDFVTFMRSNPAWSWAWFATRIGQSPSSALKQWAQFQGVVGGDIKPDNVDLVVRDNKKIRLGIVDVDDGGQGSFLGDLFHSLVYNDLWPLTVPAEELLALYDLGLRNEKRDAYEDLLESLNRRSEDLGRSEVKQKKLGKMAQDKNYFLSELKLVSLEAAPEFAKKIYSASSADFEKALAKWGQVIHRGLRIKESGGSMGLPRFTFLIQSASDYQIIEFKTQSEPAVAAAGVVQLPADQRIASLIQAYRPDGDWGAIKEVVKTSSGFFIARQKSVVVIDGGEIPDKKDLQEAYKDYVRCLFWWLGNKHGKQDATYVEKWPAYREAALPEFLQMVSDHVKESRALFEAPH